MNKHIALSTEIENKDEVNDFIEFISWLNKEKYAKLSITTEFTEDKITIDIQGSEEDVNKALAEASDIDFVIQEC